MCQNDWNEMCIDFNEMWIAERKEGFHFNNLIDFNVIIVVDFEMYKVDYFAILNNRTNLTTTAQVNFHIWNYQAEYIAGIEIVQISHIKL